MTPEENKGGEAKRARKAPVKSPYLFPAYDFGTALRIAERIDRDGGGTLTEETLAIALSVSAKSSGFRLRGLAARQFGLLAKRGETLSTTPLAQAIFKPTSEQEARDAKMQAFLAIPLFRAVANRFKGQPLPQAEAFRNVLEREFRIESNRVSAAERVLMDSAREAGVLHTVGTNTYIRTESTAPPSTPSPPTHIPPVHPAEAIQYEAAPRPGLLTISEQDLEQFDDKEFDEIWRVLGKVVRARARATRILREEAQKATEEEKEESAGEELPF